MTAGKAQVPTYALLDSGATCCAISETLALQIEAPIESTQINLATFDDQSVAERPVASFKVADLTQKIELTVTNALVGNVFSSRSELPPPHEVARKYPHLANVNFTYLEGGTVEVILGAKFAKTWHGRGAIMGNEDEPFALSTAFGPALIGPINSQENDPEASVYAIEAEPDIESLSQEIRKLFRNDFIMREGEIFPHEMSHPSEMDEVSKKVMHDSIEFDPKEGQYVVDLPWRYGREKTAEIFSTVDFYANALSRLEKLKRKFERDPWLKEGSFAQVAETIKLGHSRVLTSLETLPGSPVCYLPNLIVLHPDKPGKFRVCQDAAAQVKGHSLNKYLLTGPDNLNQLLGVLTRCRRGRYIVTADIKNFFYMVRLNKKDAPALRYLWWEDETMQKVIVLEGTVHLFGIASSPAVATEALREHFERIKHEYPPLVREVLWRSFYVDDCMLSVDDPEEGKMLKKHLSEAVERGGFQLLKWKSNCPEITNDDDLSSTPTPTAQVAETSQQDAANEAQMELTTHSNSAAAAEAATSPDSIDEDWIADINDEDEVSVAEVIEKSLKGEKGSGMDLASLVTPGLTDKLLGLGYDYTEDAFYIKLREKHGRKVATKAQVLSLIASVYDPIGMAGPFILKGRLMFQKINELEIKWREKVPEPLISEFNAWKESIVHLKPLRVPRWTSVLGLEDSVSELICFSDASAEGYGCALYVRKGLKGGGSRYHVTFLLSKCHVVPLSMMKKPVNQQQPHLDSIPRLELVAAQTSAIARDFMSREAGETFDKTTMFCDSHTVLSWIADFDRRFKTFENFRLKKIRSLSNVSEWRHVPSLLNPADYCSKGLRSNDYKKFSMLHSGPEFLQKEEAEWPPAKPEKAAGGKKNNIVDHPSVPGEHIAAIVQSPIPDDEQCTLSDQNSVISPYHLLVISGEPAADDDVVIPWPLRITAKKRSWLMKVWTIAAFKKALMQLKSKVDAKKSPPTTTPMTRLRPRKTTPTAAAKKVRITPTVSELKDAEAILIKAVQYTHFRREIETLLRLNVFSSNALTELKTKDSKLKALSPFLDANDILRLGSRVEKAYHLPYDTRYPMILPRKDEVVKTLIRHLHESNMHCSRTQTFYHLKSRFYLLGGKTAVNELVDRCVRCQWLSKQPLTQKMGALPAERVNPAVPFSTSGIDVAGPFPTSYGRKSGKRWVLVISCLCTRALCLLSLKSMDSSAVIRALTKFNSFYPGLKKIVSDNGTNFRGAGREIDEALNEWAKLAENKELLEQGIQWEFGPARCGSYGGSWERMVGMVKHSLKATMGKQVLEADTFDTVIAGIMGMLNRRPLTPASSDVDDWLVLSPAHFLFPHQFANTAPLIIPPAPDDAAAALRSSWKMSQKMIDAYWDTWQKTYLADLAKRSKWRSSAPGPRLDQLVLLKDENLSRERWKIAKVVEVISSDPQHPRRFKVKSACGTLYDRHISGLVPLELDV